MLISEKKEKRSRRTGPEDDEEEREREVPDCDDNFGRKKANDSNSAPAKTYDFKKNYKR